MSKWIVFDVDDVICNFRESLYQSFFNVGKDIHWSEWSSYNHTIIYNLSEDKELHNHMKDHFVLEKSTLEDGVLELMNRLKKNGFNIGLLTARAWHSNGQDITQDFIEKHQLPIDKLVISGQHKDKKSVHIDKFPGEIVSYIDDSIHHVQDFREKGVNALLLDRPWNQDSQLPRVFSLIEFEETLLNAKSKLKI